MFKNVYARKMLRVIKGGSRNKVGHEGREDVPVGGYRRTVGMLGPITRRGDPSNVFVIWSSGL